LNKIAPDSDYAKAVSASAAARDQDLNQWEQACQSACKTFHLSASNFFQ
jgi:hypothetical protein